VAGLGDADGDGRPDLAIGAPTDPYNWVGAAVGQDRVHLALSGHLERYRHCVPTLHSGGATARLDARGLGRLADNDLTLLVTDALPGRAGVFFFGERELDLPFGSGRRCVGGSVRRLPGLAVADASGLVQRALDLTRAPLDAVQAGSAWSFQLWFRDPDGGGANLSDALRITLRP
jgi:hypothetical protein